MELKFRKVNKTLIIQISGEIDHHTSKELREKTDSAMQQMGGKNIIFGFQNVSFMDSSGIGVMIGRYKQIQGIGGRIAIASPNEKIQQIIRLSGLSQILPCFSTSEDALTYTEGREQ